MLSLKILVNDIQNYMDICFNAVISFRIACGSLKSLTTLQKLNDTKLFYTKPCVISSIFTSLIPHNFLLPNPKNNKLGKRECFKYLWTL